MLKKQIATLLETEMDRKGFLKTTAITAIALTGVVSVFKTISAQIPASTPGASIAGRGQSSAYGVAMYGKPHQA